MSNNRLYNLDYLRGFAALGIMVYHYFTWGFGLYNPHTFLGRVGVYGVSIFYVLSGLTLYYVYYSKMKPDLIDLKEFFIKRIFRIYPLLWLITILTIITQFPTNGCPTAYSLLINFTGLFGFIGWTEAIGTGVWSIGNELVFYVFFPVFVFLAKRNKYIFLLFSIALFIIHIYFAYFLLQDVSTDKKYYYMHPLNQVFLFLGGFLIGYLFKNIHPPSYLSMILLIVSILTFIFIPTPGENMPLIVGSNRMIFTLLCFSICFSFYKLHLRLPLFFDKVLIKLGEASYSVYLVHPIVWAVLSFGSKKLKLMGINIPVEARVAICLLLTLVVSYLIYVTYEKFFIRLGKKWFTKKNKLAS
jgi:exopolysaccharide production protein ExoZ